MSADLGSEPPIPSRDHLFPRRAVALIEVLLCSDIPTQVALGGTLIALGYPAKINGHLNITYIIASQVGDAVLLIGLVVALLYAHGERPRDVLFGRRPIAGEAALGVPLTLIAMGIAIAVLLSVQRFAPSLHTVPDNPLQDLLLTRRNAWLFAFMVIVAGGVREEVQRAFLLHRFDTWLGGPIVGLVVTSVAFGWGHEQVQGVDAALATGLLGAFWGAVYLLRRSSVAPMVSHAGFDLLQIGLFLIARK